MSQQVHIPLRHHTLPLSHQINHLFSSTPNIVYQGKTNSSQPSYNEKVYFGVAEKSFKGRLYNHTKSFTHEDYANDTELFKEYCDIKRNNFIPKVTWSIVRECPQYSLSKRKCYLCLNEKLEII